MNLHTLKPGLLVSLKTSIVGNADYKRVTLEEDHTTEEGTRQARWETKRVIIDPDERDTAIKLRTQCSVLIRKPCAASAFGLLCPEDKKDELDAAIKQAQALTAEFNTTAAITRVFVYVIAGRIAADDVEAARAINSEVRALFTEMEAGLKKLDVKAVRDAANKAKSIGRMLTPGAAERIKVVVETAREAARKIVKAGEEAGLVLDRAAVKKIAEGRTAFLDITDETTEVATPAATARAIDLEPATASAPRRRKPQQPQLEV